MADRLGYDTLSTHEATAPGRVSICVNNLFRGKSNNVIDVTITEAGGAPKTVFDDRIGPMSWIGVMNLSATPAFYVQATRDGQADINWTGAGWGTRDLRLLVVA